MSGPSCAGTWPNLPLGCVPSYPACGAKNRKRNGRGKHLFAISTTFAPSSSVIFVSTLTTREISQIAKATTVETLATIQKGNDDPRGGQNRSLSTESLRT